MNYYMELIDIGVDEDRIADCEGDYETLYDQIMFECSGERFPGEPVTIEERRAMGDDMLCPTHDLFGNWED